MDYLFRDSKCAAKVSLAIGFVLNKINDESCWYFYTDEINKVMGKTKLICIANVIYNLEKDYRKWIVLSFAPGNELTLNEILTNSATWLFLRRYSKL